jgi:hypothetical protein
LRKLAALAKTGIFSSSLHLPKKLREESEKGEGANQGTNPTFGG